MPHDNIVRALYSYKASAPDELSFSEDEFICVTNDDERDDSWLMGRTLSSDRRGLVPANYVEPVEEISRVKTLYEYSAQEDNELSFVEDEILVLLSRLDSNWWLAKNLQDKFGLIPSNYVEEATNESSSISNIFQTKPDTAVSTFDDHFPGVKTKKKWTAELHKDGAERKGKLLLLESDDLVFVQGKSKNVGLSYKLAEIVSYDRKTGDLTVKGMDRDIKLILNKSDGKELQKIAVENAPLLPDPVVIKEERKHVIDQNAAPGIDAMPREEKAIDWIQNSIMEHAKVAAHEDGVSIDEGKVKSETDDPGNMIQDEDEPRVYMFAIYDYEAQDDDEMDLEQTEKVMLIEGIESDDWWLVRSENDGREGLVPKSYLSTTPLILSEEPYEHTEEIVGTDAGCSDIDSDVREDGFDGPNESNASQLPYLSELLKKSQRSVEIAKQIDTSRRQFSPNSHEQRESTEDLSQPGQSQSPPVNSPILSLPPPPPPLPNTSIPGQKAFIASSSSPTSTVFNEAPTPPPLPSTRPAAGQKMITTESSSVTSVESPRDRDELVEHEENISLNTSHRPLASPPPLPNRPTNNDEKDQMTQASLSRENIEIISEKTQSQTPISRPRPTQPAIDLAKVHLKSVAESKGLVSREESCSEIPVAVSLDSIPKPSNPWANVTLKRSDSVKSRNKHPMDMTHMSKALPSRPTKVESSSKPNASETRLWKDRSGKFQTEATFISFDKGVVILNKLNGAKVNVPIDLLSERDVEYVCRRCSLNSSLILASINSRPAETKTSNTFKVKGFDWLQFLVESGLDSKNAVIIAHQLVEHECDEVWLDGVTRDKLRTKVMDLPDSDALLIMQGVTKRKLRKLEKLGQDKILKSIDESSIIGKTGLSGRPLQGSILPMKEVSPVSVSMPPTEASVAPPSSLVNSALPSAMMPRRSIKEIPSLQPTNTLSSVKIAPQPIYGEYSSSGVIPLPNGQFAQQQTTTQYMFRTRESREAPSIISANTLAPDRSISLDRSGISNHFLVAPNFVSMQPSIMPNHVNQLPPPPMPSQGINNFTYFSTQMGASNFQPNSSIQCTINSDTPSVLSTRPSAPSTTSQISYEGDKYSIFKAVDPKSPSLLSGKLPQPLTKHPQRPPNNPGGL